MLRVTQCLLWVTLCYSYLEAIDNNFKFLTCLADQTGF